MDAQHVGTLVVGAGQAGLSTAYHLRRRGRDVLVVDGSARVADCWRQRYDSLRLFTPAKASALDGLPFPGDPRVGQVSGRWAAISAPATRPSPAPVTTLTASGHSARIPTSRPRAEPATSPRPAVGQEVRVVGVVIVITSAPVYYIT
ncbi:MAG: hypothetical protein DCC50_10070 [Acidobacteria bacterium]|nr:MAG: hypothetical protein DCC50_10070 [Acidobacteriota bacterium]